MTVDVYRREIAEQVIEGQRLGRHVLHDPRSKSYVAETATTIGSVTHSVPHRAELPLNQFNTGKCTAEALAGALNLKPNASATSRVFNDGDTDVIYERETRDEGAPWTPDNPTHNDIGGTGLAVCKAGVELGLITSYTHAFGIDQALKALTLRPVMFGVDWYEGFDNPSSSGLVKIAGQIRGGHEFVAYRIDASEKHVWFWQSWGKPWGYEGRGRFCMSFSTLDELLQSDGDATVPIP